MRPRMAAAPATVRLRRRMVARTAARLTASVAAEAVAAEAEAVSKQAMKSQKKYRCVSFVRETTQSQR